jgi:hypothetical protein
LQKLTAVEWDIITAKVKNTTSQYSLNSDNLGFLYLVLEQFFPGRSNDLAEIVTDGSNDRGIDAIEIIEKDERAEIFLFQSKYRKEKNNESKTINDAEVLKIFSFLQDVCDKADALKNTNNLRLDEAVTRIWELHERGILCRYRIVICSNDQGLSPSAQSILETSIKRFSEVTYEIYRSENLIRDIINQGRSTEVGFLQVIGREVFERTDGDIRGVISSIDANSFIDLIRTKDGTSIKRHLFDENLRIFLGKTGGYNSSIIDTATSNDSHLFWYLNNGITITCRNYSYNGGSHVNPKIKIEDFQIVNGAQTSHSLLEAARIAPESLQNVVLNVKIYATDRSDIAERVAVATNSQARIGSRDLKANHPVIKKLEIAFLARGYFFERKRNMHIDRDIKLRIDALKLGQIIMAYYLREPEKAKTESDSVFDSQFITIFNEHYDMSELCRLFELYQTIEEMKNTYTAEHRGGIEAGGSGHYLMYGNWFIIYAINLLLTKKKMPIPEKNHSRKIILEAINLVASACNQGKSVSHYQIFRSPKTKDKIFAECFGKQTTLFDWLDYSND